MDMSISEEALESSLCFPQLLEFPMVLNHQRSSALAGVSRAVVGHPFDTIKVNLQTRPELYSSSSSALRSVLKSDGIAGLFKGIRAPIFGNAATSTVHFSVFNHFHEHNHAIIAGALAGAAGSIIVSPVEYVRIKMQLANQLANQESYKCAMECAKHIIHQDGYNPFAMYRGLGITMARESIGYAAFFGAYFMIESPTGMKLVDDVLRGCVCGLALWRSMYPLDCIKSRMQGAIPEHRHHGPVWHAMDIYRTLGIRGFFKGFSITMLRAIPVNVAIVLTVEHFQLLHRAPH